MKNKKVVSFFVVSFIAPLLLAFILLKSDWSPKKQVNNGQFLTPQLTLNEWQKIEPKQWSIVQNTNNSCQQQCLDTQQQMQQISKALGKYEDKVDLVIVGSASVNTGFKSYPAQNQNLQLNTLYLVDRFGLVVLAYPLSKDAQQNQEIKRGLIKDLKKLFKYARSA